MTELESKGMRDMLETHREVMLEKAEHCERIARACRYVAERDAATIAKLRDNMPIGD